MTRAAKPGLRWRPLSLVALTSLSAIALTSGTRAAGEPEDPWRQLSEMVVAARTQNYDGVFVYHRDGQMDTMRIIHRAGPDGERERLVSLSGVPREVLRDSTRVICILPDDRSVVVGKSRPQSPFGENLLTAAGSYREYYDLTLGGTARIADRSARLVRIVPRDRYRYGYEIWIDRESRLLLKSALVGGTGKLLEWIEYTSLTLPREIPDSMLESQISGEGLVWYTSEEAKAASVPADESRWSPRWLPPGFVMQDRETNLLLPTRRTPAEHLVYGDGLASVSIFVERLETAEEPLTGISRMGAMSAYGVMVDGFQVTVVGEVPAVTVEAVGQSIDPR